MPSSGVKAERVPTDSSYEIMEEAREERAEGSRGLERNRMQGERGEEGGACLGLLALCILPTTLSLGPPISV